MECTANRQEFHILWHMKEMQNSEMNEHSFHTHITKWSDLGAEVKNWMTDGRAKRTSVSTKMILCRLSRMSHQLFPWWCWRCHVWRKQISEYNGKVRQQWRKFCGILWPIKLHTGLTLGSEF